MSKDPAFLFYSSDFLTGVSDLTFEERGQYITLLCLQHQKGRLSKKAIQIAVPNAAADVLAKFSRDENGLFFNSRLEVEAQKRAEHAEKQRKRAIEGWKKRKEKESQGEAAVNTMANAAALPLENENVNEDVNRKFNFKLNLINAGAKENLASDWLKVRTKKKAANTETALNGFLNQVEKSGLSINEVLTECIERSWSGFKSEWIEKEKSPAKKEKEPSTMDQLRAFNRALENGEISFSDE